MFFRTFIKNFYLYFLIFFVGLGLRVYALKGDPPLHIDEPCTFAVSTVSNQLDMGVWFKKQWNEYNFTSGKEYKSKDIQRAFFVAKKSLSSILKDFLVLREDNIDRQHPTLYYSLIRLWNLPLGNFDPHEYVKHARNFNLVLYAMAFFFMFKILEQIKKDKHFITIGLFFAFANSGLIMLDTMAREYSLMAMLLLVVTYITLLLSKQIIKKENIRFGQLLSCPIGFSLFLLSGYYATIYTALAFGVLAGLCIWRKQGKSLVKVIIILGLTYLLTVLFYPDYFDFANNNEHYDNVKTNAFALFEPQKVIEKLPTLKTHLGRYVFDSSVFSVVLGFALIPFLIPGWEGTENRFFSKRELAEIFVLLGCSIAWAVGVNHTVVYDYYARYVLPAAAVYCLFITVFVYRFKAIPVTIIIALTLFVSIRQIKNGTIFDKDRIWYTDSDKNHVSTYTPLPKDLPMVVVTPYYYPIEHVMFASVLPENEGIVRFEQKLPGKDFDYKKYLLICLKSECGEDNLLLNIRGDLGIYLIDKTENSPQP